MVPNELIAMPTPRLSFLIPALNEEGNIGNCLSSVRAHVPADVTFETVVGDHGSSDRTVNVAEAMGARVLRYPKSTIAELRNFLIDQSTGEIIVFIDADVCITSQWGMSIAKTLAAIDANPDQLTGSRCTPPPSKNFIISNWFAKMSADRHSYLGTGHLIFSRAVVDRIGSFDASLRTGEDYEFCMRAKGHGLQININSALAVVHHDYPLTLKAFIERERWHGSGDFQSLHRVVSSKVALAAIAFIALHLTLLLGLILRTQAAVVAAILIALLVGAMSFTKFRALTLTERVSNLSLAYFYMAGRGLSFLHSWRSIFKRQP